MRLSSFLILAAASAAAASEPCEPNVHLAGYEASQNTGWACSSGGESKWCTTSCSCRGSPGDSEHCCSGAGVCIEDQCVPRCETAAPTTAAPSTASPSMSPTASPTTSSPTAAPTQCGLPDVAKSEQSQNTGWACYSGGESKWCTTSCDCLGSPGDSEKCCSGNGVCMNNACVPKCRTTPTSPPSVQTSMPTNVPTAPLSTESPTTTLRGVTLPPTALNERQGQGNLGGKGTSTPPGNGENNMPASDSKDIILYGSVAGGCVALIVAAAVGMGIRSKRNSEMYECSSDAEDIVKEPKAETGVLIGNPLYNTKRTQPLNRPSDADVVLERVKGNKRKKKEFKEQVKPEVNFNLDDWEQQPFQQN